MRPSINPHVLNLKASATLAINQRVLQMRANGEDVFHFGFGQSPFPVPDTIQAALIAAFYDEQCGCAVSLDQVVVGPGSDSRATSSTARRKPVGCVKMPEYLRRDRIAS